MPWCVDASDGKQSCYWGTPLESWCIPHRPRPTPSPDPVPRYQFTFCLLNKTAHCIQKHSHQLPASLPSRPMPVRQAWELLSSLLKGAPHLELTNLSVFSLSNSSRLVSGKAFVWRHEWHSPPTGLGKNLTPTVGRWFDFRNLVWKIVFLAPMTLPRPVFLWRVDVDKAWEAHGPPRLS